MSKLLELKNKLSKNKNTQPATKVTREKSGPDFQFKYITSQDEAQEVLCELDNQSVSGLDIETTALPRFKNEPQAGLSPHLSQIRLLQLCQSMDNVFIFDVPSVGMDALAGFISTGKFIAHNAQFELSHLHHAGIDLPFMHCSMLMDNALRNERASLKKLAEIYLQKDISKDEQTSDWNKEKLSPEQLRYAALDAWLVYKLYFVLKDKVLAGNKGELYGLLQQAQYPVMKLQYNGVHYDAAAHYKLNERVRQEFKAAEAQVKEAIGRDINIASSKQLSDYFKETLDTKTLRRWQKTRTGDLSLDRNTVKKFAHIDAVKPLAKYSTLKNRLSSFGENILKYINPATGRLHSEFAMAYAKGGRFSCSKPNMQAIPKDYEYRALFSAPPGKKIIVADYSQVELRILAMITQDPVMLEAYQGGEDLHKLTASAVSGINPDEVTKEQRSAAKAVNFGLIYGMGAPSLSQYAKNNFGVNMSRDEAEIAKERYFEKYPGVSQWYDKTTRDSNKSKIAKTRMNRTVGLDKTFTQSKNVPIQGSAAEVFLAALVELNKITGPDIKLVNIIHDEIVLEVEESQVQRATELLETAMIDGMRRVFPECETKGLVEIGVGNSWGDAK